VIGPAAREGVSIEFTDEFTLHSDRSKTHWFIHTYLGCSGVDRDGGVEGKGEGFGMLWSEWTEMVEWRGRERGLERNKNRWKGRKRLLSEY